MDRICRECPESQIGLNLSLDGIGDEHDDIRGVPGNWTKSMATWECLKELQKTRPNLVLTVHTVVSRFNQHRFREIYDGLQFLQPDSYITEVAEERVELDTVGWGITPRARCVCAGGRLPERTGPGAAVQGHRQVHAGVPRRVLPACEARPVRTHAGHRLLCGVGQRSHRAERRHLELLHPGGAGRQPAQDEL